MLVDGRAIAKEIYQEVANIVSHLNVRPHLTAFTCAPDFATKSYLNLKKKKAESVGVGINVIEFPADISQSDIKQSIEHSLMQTDGVIVQLPFPAHINIDEVLNSVPVSYDVDVMHYDGTDKTVLPPVVGAIAEIGERQDILFAAQQVVVVGQGRLVGAPAAIWAQKQGAQVTVLTAETKNNSAAILEADILILGTGVAGLIKPNMIKDGVIIFDGGTSEDGGELKGDADPACTEKAALITPVPGGIGPITVAILLRNLVTLTKRAQGE